MAGPPMSMFSIASARVTAGLGDGFTKGVEIHTHQIDGRDAVPFKRSHVLGQIATRQDAACTFGCRVLTRPSSISGKPV
jgi:hypothetical protein